jgi:competence protein ComEC
MADGPDHSGRARAWAAEVDAARRRAGLVLPDEIEALLGRLRQLIGQWALAEVAPGRLFPWLAVGFGAGVVLYFTADREPALWAALPLAMFAVAIAFRARRRALGFPLTLGFAALAAGFAVATLNTARIAHPVLRIPASSVNLTGFVEVREERERSDRIVVHVHHLDGRVTGETPERVRIAVRKDTAPAVGSFVALKAHLSPPLAPLRPGGYDFARDMYFSNIGASGYALGKFTIETPPVAPSIALRFAAAIDGMRESIDKRIRTVIPGDEGAIASALITGKRDAITPAVSDAFYVSSLAHVLAISGYHMAVVAGIAFFFIRGILALMPSLASRYPIKKWAAAGALGAAIFYLVLSGAGVATQRSFVMIAIVLTGVMVDRRALTFRTLTLATFAVLLLAPQAVAHPSFQMSFAATLALIAGYQYALPWRAGADTSAGARAALWGGNEIAALLYASLIAGLATTPYAAFHFHRLAPYGVLANLAAMPVVSVWVMPMGILGLIAMPFGFDAVFWTLMGKGIDWMIGVVLWVANLPGAAARIHAFGSGPLLLATAGLLLLCLLRTPLRWSGAVLAIVASLWAVATPQPDILIAADGQAAAIRSASGRLSVLSSGRDTFAIKEWLAADGDTRGVKDATLKDGVRCDAIGCIGTLKDGRPVAMALSAEAFAEDCARAAVVVSPRQAPGDCAALLIDRRAWRANGAIGLRAVGGGFEMTPARPPSSVRPWAPVLQPAGDATTRLRPGARDATPRLEDLEEGDQ